ncbi:MAG: hypothetical protein COW30_18615 [Rhodospirillales bacterium CG15_BIG_FIL_POST_REV_8_21_14_020_66_15]|nr:MAG: hypothetical protein COW30_18615 [Rhodospirillales bacterium CG15_BIG_FIL_POST_REV_8_21_14_020_66_15]
METTMKTSLFAILALVLTAALPCVTLAADGQLNAISSKPLPGGKVLAVRALDDSDAALDLTAQFERELKARGYRVDPKAELVLTFEVLDELGAYSFTDKRYFLDVQGTKGTSTGIEGSEARFNVFDSKTGGILNEGHGGTKIVTPTKYRLKVTIDGPAEAGRIERYWQGWATGNLGAATNESLIGAMVAPLTEIVGKTVKNETFSLPN